MDNPTPPTEGSMMIQEDLTNDDPASGTMQFENPIDAEPVLTNEAVIVDDNQPGSPGYVRQQVETLEGRQQEAFGSQPFDGMPQQPPPGSFDGMPQQPPPGSFDDNPFDSAPPPSSYPPEPPQAFSGGEEFENTAFELAGAGDPFSQPAPSDPMMGSGDDPFSQPPVEAMGASDPFGQPAAGQMFTGSQSSDAYDQTDAYLQTDPYDSAEYPIYAKWESEWLAKLEEKKQEEFEFIAQAKNKAMEDLDKFYDKLMDDRANRGAVNREAEQHVLERIEELIENASDTPWARVFDLIDIKLDESETVDKSRMRSILIKLKEHGLTEML
mmetsp:Transcript_36974/g.48681  ORF Transcript_36974/g.48681 Transcript_36974/m.48681 type:complete len:326 (-) Transcript_36974:308-1285(-)